MTKMVLKVPMVCKKCKSCSLQIVSKLKGIKSMTFDEEKNTLTVVGEVDVVKVVAKLRKAKHPATVVTVSDEKKEAEEKKKKDEEEKKKKEKEAEEKKKKEIAAALMQYCPKAYPQPQQAYCYTVDDHPGSCTIV
ncbi:hypothetical protein QYE76_054560 [Lolium multiflorum]|uniref:HMA domain-containing protein n=1 Tax=Lolium multiflorum TaxID=4521 RepID=A0AAD8WLH0_LOLMU|nr:hypothetical protein QYE76_054560 [Lolium multiflorum]